MSKGSAFEREIAKRLSLWWTQEDNPRDDVFWRTDNSGGRATSRGGKGRKTANSHGDIMYLDPIGKPLLDLITFEVKRGYAKDTLHDLLDKADKAALQTYEKWFVKAKYDSVAAGTPYWMLISRRDKRVALVLMPANLYQLLEPQLCSRLFPHVVMSCFLKSGELLELDVLQFDDFIQYAKPEYICKSLRLV